MKKEIWNLTGAAMLFWGLAMVLELHSSEAEKKTKLSDSSLESPSNNASDSISNSNLPQLDLDRSKANSGDRYWPQWRGPFATGVAPHAIPPMEWSEDKNVRWKLELPGRGHSTPVIWDDRLFVTTAVRFGDAQNPAAGHRPGAHDNISAVNRHKLLVLAISRRNGKIVWQNTVREIAPHEGGHRTGSYASASPVTDGERVYAFFGSQGLFCLDWNGKVLWEKDLGDMHTKHGHGEGSTPALYGNTLIVNWDHEGASFVVALDKRTGVQRWKQDRDEVSSWSTPIIVEHKGNPQVIISATGRIRSYHLASGNIIWECSGLSHNVVASPVSGNGMVYAGSSYEKRIMLGIRLADATADITGSDQVVWRLKRHTPYVPSLLLYDDKLYFLKHYQGSLTCVNASTGEVHYGPRRLPEIYNVYASPVAAAGRVYITSQEGVTVVLKHGSTPDILKLNSLNDNFSASPALVDREMFLRGHRYLYCLAEE